MMTDDQMAYVTSIQVKYIEELMQKPHVVGVAVGLAMKDGSYTDEISIVVMVDEKVSNASLSKDARIPEELEGVRVDVQETGNFMAYDE